ncbi:hypothetical protein [Streptomyces sp. NBC_01212]|uniref:hypothetical protein n=1 Tax=Streptomyces sp. NBC_01212 TaxID=2903775 RepID=UPI002E11960D|nr:hypothetical protein OG722_04875 [Streptomyces sp. NBC_01212]
MTPDEVRAIVREEIREALKVLQKEADNYPGYETGQIEDAASRMLESVAEATAEKLRHTPECKVRNGGRYWSNCDCGAEELL